MQSSRFQMQEMQMKNLPLLVSFVSYRAGRAKEAVQENQNKCKNFKIFLFQPSSGQPMLFVEEKKVIVM